MSNATTTANGQSQSTSFFQTSTSTTSFFTSSSTPPTTTTPTPTTSTSSTSTTPPTTVTSVITPTSQPNQQPTTVTLTSTSQTPTPTQNSPSLTSFSTTSSSSSSATSTPLTNSNSPTASKKGLGSGAKIGIGVAVPVVVVSLIIIGLFFWWRKRKQRKDAAELRRKEVEEYGFNPNKDPTLPAVGGASSSGEDPYEMREDDTAGYRGWGATSNPRKPSTTLSGGGPIGMAISDHGSNGAPPTSSDSPNHGVDSAELPAESPTETVGALGGAPVAGANRQDNIHRGTSNASSSYSAANRSDSSGDGPFAGGAHPAGYYANELEDSNYYAGGGQPVIRDVQARRNTRIENPSVVPQKGNTGISQNF
ncbi:MAG: hypothetical protein M4579_006533 [Chaenotheca gracillima]|nr:MAG: hypothetical protein M4579_006533 [Chaenotheca gracillima]